MSEQRMKWSPIKEIIFTYLAINKIMYWFNTVITMNAVGGIGGAVFMRIISQDLPLIIGIVALFVFDEFLKTKHENNNSILSFLVSYVVSFFILLLVYFTYFLIMAMIFLAEFSIADYISDFIEFIPMYTLAYVVVVVVLEVKQYFKKKSGQ